MRKQFSKKKTTAILLAACFALLITAAAVYATQEEYDNGYKAGVEKGIKEGVKDCKSGLIPHKASPTISGLVSTTDYNKGYTEGFADGYAKGISTAGCSITSGGSATLSAPEQLSPKNGATFSNYPRTTKLEWSPVSGAANYTVEIDCYHCCQVGKWCTEVGNAWKTAQVTTTSYTFDFVGANSGRWRVWAVNANGQEGPKSQWSVFNYTV